MKSYDIATYNALVAAPEQGLRERDLVTIWPRTLAGGAAAPFCFWNDLDTVSINVYRGDSGVQEARSFVGDGALLKVGRIRQTSDLTIPSVTISLSQIHATVQNMARGHDLRQAAVEIHRLLLDPATNAPVSAAHCHFVGKVNKAPIGTPKSGEEGALDITVVSHLREMTRGNPAKKSDETQRLRSDDRFRRYIGTANVKVFWGTETGRTSDTSNTTNSEKGRTGSSRSTDYG